MFTIRFVTEEFAPGQTVLMRWAPDWNIDRGGVYTGGAWTFDIDETRFPFGIQFKFLLAPGRWSDGPNLFLAPADMVGIKDFGPDGIVFPPMDALVTERGVVPQRFFGRNLDPNHQYDVIVVGSGMGGGLLASTLADQNADVLLLEAGSYLFPTHVANLPRRLKIGQFDKHVWSLWPDFKVTNYVNVGAGSVYAGGQGFNLGGRSLFWGGLIPRQVGYELDAWPAPVRDYLLGPGFPAAETALNRVPPAPTAFQDASRQQIQNLFPGYLAEDAGVAVQYSGATKQSIPAGLFSTADLLMEDRLLAAPGYRPATVNLNVAVWTVTTAANDPATVTGVVGWDLLGNRQRTFSAKTVVICAGTLESAKIALQSGLVDPNNKIGIGITDHAIRFRHFTLPPDPARNIATDSAKVLLRHPGATPGVHAFDVVVEFGADFNQGRYVAPDNLAQARESRDGWMLCEVVFMSYTGLNEGNFVAVTGQPADPVQITMFPTAPSPADTAEQNQLAANFFGALGAQEVPGEGGLALQTAAVGGVAHEVGTLRMAGDGTGVVDENLKFLAYDNLYACDNSVFPTSPAANPSLTLAALALRLADHLA